MLTRLLHLISKGKDSSFLVKKASLAFILKLSGMFAQYFFIFIVSRFLGPHELGVFTLSYTVLQLTVILALFGLDNLMVRILAAARSAGDFATVRTVYNQFIRITLFNAFVLAAIVYFTADIIASSVFNKPLIATSIRMAAFGIPPFVMMAVNSAAFRGYKHMTGFTVFRGLIPLLSGLFVLFALYAGWNASPVACTVVSLVLVMMISFISWNKFSKLTSYQPAENKPWKSYLNESLPMLLTGSVFFIMNWADNLMIGIFRTETELGLYDAAFKLASASAIILMAINAIQGPSIAEFHSKKEYKRLQNYILTSNRLLFFSTIPLTLALLIFPSEILSILGKGFSGATDTLRILALANFASCMTGSVGIILQMTGHQKSYNKIVSATALLSILMNLVLVPLYGITGAAISSATAKIIQNAASAFQVNKLLGIQPYYIPGMRLNKKGSKDAT